MATAIDGYELSPQQRRAWAFAARGGDVRAQVLLELEGELDEARLARALDRVAARHEILCSTFRRVPGMSAPLQLVGEPAARWRRADTPGGEHDGLAELPRRARRAFAPERDAVAALALPRSAEHSRHTVLLTSDPLHLDAPSFALL